MTELKRGMFFRIQGDEEIVVKMKIKTVRKQMVRVLSVTEHQR